MIGVPGRQDRWGIEDETVGHLRRYERDELAHTMETRLSLADQTKTSGLQAIPFKTVFPACFALVLNRFTLSPLFLLQRLFYPTRLGLTLLGIGQLNRARPRFRGVSSFG